MSPSVTVPAETLEPLCGHLWDLRRCPSNACQQEEAWAFFPEIGNSREEWTRSGMFEMDIPARSKKKKNIGALRVIPAFASSHESKTDIAGLVEHGQASHNAYEDCTNCTNTVANQVFAALNGKKTERRPGAQPSLQNFCTFWQSPFSSTLRRPHQ